MEPDADLAVRAKAKGWPDGLLDRAIKLNTSRNQLDFWLSPQGPSKTFDIERLFEVLERLRDGPLRAREVTSYDHDAFSHLWANASEAIGEWEITVERGPNAFAQFQLQGDASVTVLDEAGELVACTVWASTNLMVGGKPTSIHFAQGLRVRNDRRRLGLGDVVRRFPSRALQRPSVGQVMYMRLGNDGIDGFLKKVGFQAEGARPQKLVTVDHLTASPQAPAPQVRAASRADAAACAALINRTHEGLDLFAPLDAGALTLKLDGQVWGEKPAWWKPIYEWPDFHVFERDGRITACAGLWDRGRDIRERWLNPATGETRAYDGAALLDFGCEDGGEEDLAALIRHLVGVSHKVGRTSLAAPLGALPKVAQSLSDLDRRPETRILEWSPYAPFLPRELGEVFIDLRFW